MAGNQVPIPLIAQPITISSQEFAAICSWPFADAFVRRLLQSDVPVRAQYGSCRVFLYKNPAGQLVGFGTIDVCSDYASITNAPHPYIPLLAVNPTIKSLGYGTSILNHVIAEAALLTHLGMCCDTLLLDTYVTSTKARALYERAGFAVITEEMDPVENARYMVMAKRVSIGLATLP